MISTDFGWLHGFTKLAKTPRSKARPTSSSRLDADRRGSDRLPERTVEVLHDDERAASVSGQDSEERVARLQCTGPCADGAERKASLRRTSVGAGHGSPGRRRRCLCSLLSLLSGFGFSVYRISEAFHGATFVRRGVTATCDLATEESCCGGLRGGFGHGGEKSAEAERQAHAQWCGVTRCDGLVPARATFRSRALVGQQMTEPRGASEEFAAGGDLEAFRDGFFGFLHRNQACFARSVAAARCSTKAEK